MLSIANPDQYPFVVYNSQVLTNKVFTLDEVYKTSPDFQANITNLARGRGGVKTGSYIAPQTYQIQGHINPANLPVQSITEGFKYAQHIKNTFSQDSTFFYVNPNNHSIFINPDDVQPELVSGIGGLNNIEMRTDFAPQIGTKTIVGTIDSSDNEVGIQILSAQGQDLSKFFDPANFADIWGLGFCVYVDNPQALQDLAQIQIIIGNDASNFVAFDTTALLVQTILNYDGEKLKKGWNFLTIPLSANTGTTLSPTYVPTFAVFGTPDFSNIGQFKRLVFTVPENYEATNDQIALGGAVFFKGTETFVNDCVVNGNVEFPKNYSSNYATSFSQNITVLDTRTKNYFTEPVASEFIVDLPKNIDIKLGGIGEQFPVFEFEMSDTLDTLNISELNSNRTLTIHQNFQDEDRLVVDTFTNQALLNGSPVLLNGVLPNFRDGISKLQLNGSSATISPQNINYYAGSPAEVAVSLDQPVGLTFIQVWTPPSDGSVTQTAFDFLFTQQTASNYTTSGFIAEGDVANIIAQTGVINNNFDNRTTNQKTIQPNVRNQFVTVYPSPVMVELGKTYFIQQEINLFLISPPVGQAIVFDRNTGDSNFFVISGIDEFDLQDASGFIRFAGLLNINIAMNIFYNKTFL